MKQIKDIEIEDKVPSLETIVFDTFDKYGMTPTNSEWKLMKVLSSAIEEYIQYKEQNSFKKIQRWMADEYSPELEKWLINDYGSCIQDWLIEEFIPSLHKFNYWAIKEFPKTFNRVIKEENQDNITENIEEAEYEEI